MISTHFCAIHVVFDQMLLSGEAFHGCFFLREGLSDVDNDIWVEVGNFGLMGLETKDAGLFGCWVAVDFDAIGDREYASFPDEFGIPVRGLG